MISQIEFAFLGHCEDFFGSIFEAARSRNCLDGPVSLYLNFGVLFPAAYVCRHVVKHDFLLKELVHLLFNGVFITSFDKRSCIVDARHCVKILVLSRENSTNSEIIIEQVFAMTPVRHTIINKKLQHDFNGCLAMER